MDEIVIIFILIFLNGLFSMSEIAVISAKKVSLSNAEKKGSKGARAALRLAGDPDRFLSTVQIGITLIGILTGIFSGQALSVKVSSLLSSWGMPSAWAVTVGQTLIVVVVTYLTIVLGELVPKRIGMSLSGRVSRLVARPMLVLSFLAAPFVWILSKSTEMLVRLLGIGDAEDRVTEEDIKSFVQEGREDGAVEAVEQDIVERVFLLGDLKVGSLMTHRSEVVTLDAGQSGENIREVLSRDLYEAYPVVDRSRKQVVGVVSLKDLVLRLGGPAFDLHEIMRPPVYFYENMSVYRALEQMKGQHLSRVLVCDEFGSFRGIITLRDILEGLVGNIEEAGSAPAVTERADGSGWLVDGRCPLYAFLSYFEREDLYDASSLHCSTVAGLVIEQMKHIPRVGEHTRWNGFGFEIADMDGARVNRLLVTQEHEGEGQSSAGTDSPETSC